MSGEKLPLSILRDLLEYIQNGPERILLRHPRFDRRFVAFYREFRLAQMTLGGSADRDYQSIALYLPAPEAIPSVEAPLIRKTAGTIPHRTRYTKQRSWPKVRMTIHRLPTGEFSPVASAVSSLDQALQAMPPTESGIDFEAYYREPSFDPTAPLVDVTGSYFREVKRGPFDAGFLEVGDSLGLNESWMALWQSLDSISRHSPPTRKFRDAYDLSPESYLVALLHELRPGGVPLR